MNEDLLSTFQISLSIDKSKNNYYLLMFICILACLPHVLSGIAKGNLRKKHPDLMKKFSMMRFTHGPSPPKVHMSHPLKTLFYS